jgi:hypothetical protein
MPTDIEGYEQSYEEDGVRMIYFDQIFGQWTYRFRYDKGDSAQWLPLVGYGALIPAPHLMIHANDILRYYDQQVLSSATTSVIGIHLRIESDSKGVYSCGSLTQIVDRLCKQLEAPCDTSICIIATDSPRSDYDKLLACQQILTKDDAWTSLRQLSPLEKLNREENAIIGLWTVTRAHIFAGCGQSTLSIAGYSLHPLRLNDWLHHSNPLISSMASRHHINGTAALYYSPLVGAEFGGGCSRGVDKWIHDHRLDDKGVVCAPYSRNSTSNPSRRRY